MTYLHPDKLAELRMLLALDLGDESDLCIDIAVRAAEAVARLDRVTEALIAARGIIVEDAKACRAFRHESEGPSGPENVLAKIDEALNGERM